VKLIHLLMVAFYSTTALASQSQLGRTKDVEWPDLNFAAGAGQVNLIQAGVTSLSDDSDARFEVGTAVADSTLTGFTHNLGVAIGDLNIVIYTGTHPALTRVTDPVGDGWVIAAGAPAKEVVNVTTPGAGGPHTFAVTIQHQVEASATQDGSVSTGAQTWAGAKTLSGNLTVNADSSLDGALTVNEAGADKDTRVEGDTEVNLIFVNAGTDQVGVAVDPSDYVGNTRLSVNALGSAGNEHLYLSKSGDFGIKMSSNSAGNFEMLAVAGGTNTSVFEIDGFGTLLGQATFNSTNLTTADFIMEGLTDANTFRMDASTDRVGFGLAAPAHKIDVVGTAGLSTGTAWTNTSDERLKDILVGPYYGLDAVRKLDVIWFKYKKDNPLELVSPKPRMGFVAQNVQKVIPEAVTLHDDDRGDGDYLELNVDPIHWATVNAVKELADQVDKLRKELARLKEAS